jgi:xylulokinase
MFLGIDLGTASVKAMLVDAAGTTIATASEHYAVQAPQPGWGETHPDAWWRAVVAAVNRLEADQRKAVRAIGFSGQMHGVVLCDEDAVALRPAILWLDARGREYLREFPDDSGTRTGNQPAAGMAASSLLWLKQHEPRNYAAARWALQPKDWLRFKMGGAIATDASDACGTQLASVDGEWDRALVDALALRSDWLPAVQPAHAPAGTLSAAAAAQLGLRASTALVTGAGDTAAASLGSGLLRDGDAQLTTGTGGQIVVMRAQRPSYNAQLNAFRSANPAPFAAWYVMAAMLNVGSALEWARAILNMNWDECYRAAEQAVDEELIFLPYLAGERTPLMDAGARGAWIGLSAAATKAHMMRAAFEGVAFSLRAGLDALQRAGHEAAALRLAGGGSLQPWWRQLLADALAKPLLGVDVAHASARGAALLAGLGVGHWSVADLPRLAPSWRLAAEPRSDANLARRCARWAAVYPRLRDWF